jgi:hypothetical protein
MTWNFDISSAPRGKTVTIIEADKDGKIRERQEFRHDHVILASKCGRVMRSYWIPDESRWCMFKKGEEPVAWMHWPDHPGVKPVHQHDNHLPIIDDVGGI